MLNFDGVTEEPNCVDSQESTQFFKNILLHSLLHSYYIAFFFFRYIPRTRIIIKHIIK